MFSFHHKNGLASFPLPVVSRLAGSALLRIALFGGLLALLPAGSPATAASLGDDPQPELLGDDGFTRESLMDFTAPEPTPFAQVSTGSIEAAHRRHYARTAASHRRQWRRERPGQPIPQVVVKAAPHRNPAQSFVYWWNGFVINTFHTKFGTVFLDSVGARS